MRVQAYQRETLARKDMELGQVLAPLTDFREKMLFLRGLYNQEALIGGIHSCQTGNLLTGAHLAPAGETRDFICFEPMTGITSAVNLQHEIRRNADRGVRAVTFSVSAR